MPTLLDILNKTAGYLKHKGIENYRLDAQLLLGHVLKLERLDLYLNFDRPLSENELNTCRAVVRRRASREPLQHILGHVQFRELTIKVDRRALVPRKETEQILDVFQKVLPRISKTENQIAVLDVGLGTGVIALSLMREYCDLDIYGVEKSSQALSLAKENAEINQLPWNVDKMKAGKLFSPFTAEMHWDIIISNPPYVSEKEFINLQPEVRDWDPAEALLGGMDGTEFPVDLINQSFGRLNSPGYLILEIGAGQSSHILKGARNLNWRDASIEDDFSGLERFIVLEK